tara:strand:- start:300 stop:419 length:120 start_codon:yes stop_codon:yes gene_type:complete
MTVFVVVAGIKLKRAKRIRQKGLGSVERTKRAKLAYSCQ